MDTALARLADTTPANSTMATLHEDDFEPYVDDVTPKMTRELKSVFDYLNLLYSDCEKLVGDSSKCRKAAQMWMDWYTVFLEDLTSFGGEVPEFLTKDMLVGMKDTAERYRRLLR